MLCGDGFLQLDQPLLRGGWKSWVWSLMWPVWGRVRYPGEFEQIVGYTILRVRGEGQSRDLWGLLSQAQRPAGHQESECRRSSVDGPGPTSVQRMGSQNSFLDEEIEPTVWLRQLNAGSVYIRGCGITIIWDACEYGVAFRWKRRLAKMTSWYPTSLARMAFCA